MTGLERGRFTPQKDNSAILKEQNKRLKPGQKLLLAGHSFLASLAFEQDVSGITPLKNNLNQEKLFHLMNEYFSINNLLLRLVGKENLLITENFLAVGKISEGKTVREDIRLPSGNSALQTVKTPFLTNIYNCWPREAHTLIDGKILINNSAWKLQNSAITVSDLGEGGKVLTQDKTILVTPDIYEKAKDELKNLISEDYRIGVLPLVMKAKQGFDFTGSHIDGHASLIKDKNNKLALVVADSYFRQGNDSQRLIKKASKAINAQLIEVDDRNLPPLAFNMLQFEDKSVAMTGSVSKNLEAVISDLVGKNKVFTTGIPLTCVPKLSWGGIRCLTNTIPSWVINSYNSSNTK